MKDYANHPQENTNFFCTLPQIPAWMRWNFQLLFVRGWKVTQSHPFCLFLLPKTKFCTFCPSGKYRIHCPTDTILKLWMSNVPPISVSSCSKSIKRARGAMVTLRLHFFYIPGSDFEAMCFFYQNIPVSSCFMHTYTPFSKILLTTFSHNMRFFVKSRREYL